jgi:hypothetical protein
VERLEERVEPSISIPPAIDPTTAPQALFGLGDTSQIVHPAPAQAGPDRQLFRFTLDEQAPGQLVRFNLHPVNPQPTLDSAIGLYDAAGNLVASADVGLNGSESLTTSLATGTVYVLGLFSDPSHPAPAGFALETVPGPQVTNPTVAIDPGTGTAHVPVGVGEDAFNSSADVDYYPLDLTNGGASGTVTVTPAGSDVHPFATLFRRDDPKGPWLPVASAAPPSGAAVLNLVPPAGGNLTDATYLLALAPRDFSTAAGGYSIDVSTAPLAPVPLPAAQFNSATNLLAPLPKSAGVAEATRTDPLGNSPVTYHFRAPAEGTSTVAVQSSAFGPIVSVYDATGTQLLGTVTRTQPGSTSLNLPVTAGSEYVVRVTSPGSQGAFTLTIDTPYTPAPVDFGPGGTAMIASADVSPAAGAKYYRLEVNPSSNVLAVRVTPGATTAPEIAILRPDGSVVFAQAAAGQTLFLPTRLLGGNGPTDLYVAGTAGTDPVTIDVGQFAPPNQLNENQIFGAELGLDGSLNPAPQPVPGFGGQAAVAYYSLLSNPTDAPTTFTATGGFPLIARYEEDGGVLHLADWQLPDPVSGQASLVEPVTANRLEAVAGFALGFDPNPQVQFHVAAPAPVGVGVGTVPDLTIQPPNYQAVLKIDKVTLESGFQQQLWQTILPDNLTGAPVVTFKPNAVQGPLMVRFSVYEVTAGGLQLFAGPLTNAPGQPLPVTLNQPNLGGSTLLFRVEGTGAGQLGDGIYSIDMTVPTSNPLPYLLGDTTAWKLPGTNPTLPAPQGSPNPYGVIPAGEPIVDIAQDQFGHGEATGQFTDSSTPGGYPNSPVTPSTGQIDVYRFWAVNPGPVSVKTVAEPGSHVNTTVRVYRGTYDANGVLFLDQISNLAPNTDWYPADRSAIDAQVYATDFETTLKYAAGPNPFGTGGGMYFAVVRNEGGSQGAYRLEVDTAPFPLAGDAQGHVTTFPVSGGTVPVAIPDLTSFVNAEPSHNNPVHQTYVGYFPVQMPNYHTGTLLVDAVDAPAGWGPWEFELYDAAGNPLTRTIPRIVPVGHTQYDFAVRPGMQTLYLRVQAPTAPGFTPTVNLTATLPTFSPTPPPATVSQIPGYPFLSPALLPTDPFGNATIDPQQHDGRLHDALTASGTSRLYQFQPPAGAMTVTVAPDTPGDVSLRWGVYANSVLVGWGLGDSTGQTFALPAIRQFGLSPDADYDQSTYQNVWVLVQALSNAQTTGQFSVDIQSNAVRPADDTDLADKPTGQPSPPANLVTEPARPMRNADLAISPLTGSGATAVPFNWKGAVIPTTVNGTNWVVLSVPAQATGPAIIQANVGATYAGQLMLFELSDASGHYLDSGATVVGPSGTAVQPLTKATAGASYFLRVGLPTAPLVAFNLTASASLPAVNAQAKPPAVIPDFTASSLLSLTPAPDGTLRSMTVGSANLAMLWVGQGGHGQFTALPNFGAKNFSLALYRAHFYFSGEVQVPNYELSLVDFQSTAIRNFYTLSVDLDPGLYVLRIANSPNAQVSGQVPAYPVEEIVLDPNQGNNFGATEPYDRERSQVPMLESFRTRYFHVIAPPGSESTQPLTVTATGELKSNALVSDPGGGQAGLTVWTRSAGQLTQLNLPAMLPPQNPKTPKIAPTVQVQESPTPPGQDYWVALTRSALAGGASVATKFVVPLSGTPDLVVTDFRLVPDNGQTLAQVTVENRGFATAPDTTARLNLTDTANHLTPSDLEEFALGPFASRVRVFPFQPTALTDTAEYLTDFVPGQPAGNIQEISETNNTSGKHDLSEFDLHAPTATILEPKDANGQSVDANPDPNVWGRYLADTIGPRADLHAAVADDDLYRAFYKLPAPGVKVTDELLRINDLSPGQTDFLLAKNFAFGGLESSGPDNLNQVQFWVEDTFGVTSPVDIRQVQVVPRPAWATNIDYDDTKHTYTLTLDRALVAYGDPNDPTQPITVAQLTGFDMPGIGDLKNQFLIAVNSTVTADLNPGNGNQTLPPVPLAAHVKLTALSQDLFDQTFDGSAQPTDHLTVSTNLKVDQLTLQPTALDLTFRLTDLSLFHYQTPKITLFSYGIPDLASLEIDLQFSIDVTLNAAATVVFDPALLNDPLAHAIPVGIGKPTFIEPSVTLGAEVSGEAEVLGFDLASISGGVNFTLNVTVAVDPKGQPAVPLDEVPDHLGVDVSGDLGVVFKAKVLGITVWSFEPDPIHMDFGGNLPPDITEPLQSALQAVNPPAEMAGDHAVGAAEIDPMPNLVIDPVTGRALYVQLVNADPADPHGNLAFATRDTANTWTGLTTLPQTDAVSDPALALTGDAPNAAVVTYLDQPADPSRMFADWSLDDTLKAEDLRYRYFDGTTWHTEQALTNDTSYDSDPVTAFNASGHGVVAWVHNTAGTPVVNGLDQAHGDIAVAVWDPATHAFGTPTYLTADPDAAPVADSKPAVFAAADGTLYAVWLRDVNGTQTPMFSVFVNESWTPAAPLGITGLPAGGRFNQFAIGSGKAGRTDVLMAYTSANADGTNNPVLYDRPGPAVTSNNPASVAAFAAPAAVETVAAGGSFAHLRAIPDPVHGGLVAYWQQSNGQHNDVYAASYGAPGWAAPVRLSSNPNLTFDPSVAIDADGTFQTVYQSAPLIATPVQGGPPVIPTIPLDGPADQPVGAPVGTGVATSRVTPAPEWAFAEGLFFPYADAAASGTMATGQARIVNRGTLAGDVQYQGFLGDPAQGGTPVGSPRTIHLAPGQAFDASTDFPVQPGQATYAIQLIPLNPATEAVTTADDVSTATLTGKLDVAVTAMSVAYPDHNNSAAAKITVDVTNPSDRPVSPFDLVVYQHDPALGPKLAPVAWTYHVSGLGPNQKIHVTKPWTVPAAGGDFTLTAVADPAKKLDEATRGNNMASADLNVRALPAVRLVTANLLNYSGSHNVSVTGQLVNLGEVSLTNVRVRLYRALDDGPLQQVAEQLVALPAGKTVRFTFIADGLAGRNRYRVVLDPDQTVPDPDRSDDSQETTLIIQGLPDLIPLSPTLVETQHPTQGQQLTLRAQVRNAGIRGAENVLVEVFWGDPHVQGSLIGKTTVAWLPALSLATVDIPLDTTKLIGPVSLTVIVDRLEKILETSDRNNRVALRANFRAADRVAPTSAVAGLPATTSNPNILLHWGGSDGPTGGPSGIARYDIDASEDGGPFHPWLVRTTRTSATFPGQEGRRYAFYSVATDLAGNVERAPATPDASTQVTPPSGVIRGVAYSDANGNRQRDPGEKPLAGVTVFLDTNGNGRPDPGEPTTQTDANGAYSFTGLRVGSYTVTEVLPAGFVETDPGSLFGVENPTTNFLPASGPGQHYAWADFDPYTPAVIDIGYDFRSLNGFANHITPAEEQAAVKALQAWSDATGGRIRFVRDAKAPAARVITIGVGDVAATHPTFAPPGDSLGFGGAVPVTINGKRTLTAGFAWLNENTNWATALEQGFGTFDFFSGVAHEIGHALGLGDLNPPPRSGGPADIMDGTYSGALHGPSAVDVANIRAVYPASPPTPGTPLTYPVTLAPKQAVAGRDFGKRKLPPTVSLPSFVPVQTGTPTTFDLGSFADVGAVGPWAVSIDWGDGTKATQFTVSEAGALSADHTFAQARLYTVTVAVTDEFGATGYATFLISVEGPGL